MPTLAPIDDHNGSVTLTVTSRLLTELGLDAAEELARVGVDEPLEELTTLPRAAYCALWQRAMEVAGPDVGVRFAEGLRPGALGFLEWGAITASTLREGFETVAKHGALLHTGGHYELVERHDAATFVYHSGSTVPPRALIDWSLGYLLRCVRRVASRDVEVREVRLQYPAPRDREAVERFFGAPVVFGCSRNEIVLPRAALDVALVSADPQVHASLRAIAEKRAAAVRREPALLTKARAIVLEEISNGQSPTLESVAAVAGVGERTLQRRFRESKTSFRAVLQDARLELAATWLRNPSRSVSEVAFAVGYADTSAFARAFRRRFGCSPGEHRDRAAA
ncbi:MAG: AraC family transcriptional regulator [Sandaracinaceae bacterium]|nr:AraC family transcriptional regulator [Sandaracinaceae bacterium]